MLNWELRWIDDNVHMYDSPMHAEAVKRNIEKRYMVNELISKLNKMQRNEAYLQHKVQLALESCQRRINTAKHYDPCPLNSKEWKGHFAMLQTANERYTKTGSAEDALILIGLAESSTAFLYYPVNEGVQICPKHT